MSFLQLSSIDKIYQQRGQAVHALSNVDLNVEFGEFICILGVSGCGKSTMLQLVGGLDTATSGTIVMNGEPIQGVHPDTSIVFQEHGLFPWMTAQRNVEFNLKARGVAATERARVANDLIRLVGLEGFQDKYPHQLSGGMRQRIGIARALSTDPKLMLMDEPFGALDAQTRSIMQDELLRVWQANRRTVIFITHSVEEAVHLADRIVIMTPRPGRIRGILPVDLPRPRDSGSAAFARVVGQVHEQIRDDLRSCPDVIRTREGAI